ncbi:MAG TPA: hypothetical protein VGQ81_04980 [Acidobacteriota bacterium]|nr:hypothetical protein [Acidobacteriota bacterium]
MIRLVPACAYCFIVLLFLPAVWRFKSLERDPTSVSGEVGTWIDPGHYIYNARSRALFGEWRADEGTSLYLTPGYSFLLALWFYFVGAGYAQAALLSVIAGLVLIVATAVYARAAASAEGNDLPGFWAAGAALTFLLLSYVMCAVQHIPKGDIESVAVCSLTALAFAKLQSREPSTGGAKSTFTALAAGFGVGFAPFMKTYSVQFSAACVIAWIVSYYLLSSQWKRVWRRTTPWVGFGFVLALLVWAGWAVWLLKLNVFQRAGSESLRVIGIVLPFLPARGHPSGQIWTTFSVWRFLQSNVFYRHPVESLLTTLATARFVFSRKWNWPLLLAFTWLVVGVIAMSIMSKAPTRYRLLSVPPATVLAACLWTELATQKMERLGRRKDLLTYTFSAAVLAYVVLYSASIRVPAAQWISNRFVFLSLLVCAVPILAILTGTALKRIPHRWLAILLAAIMAAVALPQWWIGERSTSYELRNTARHIVESYPHEILGQWWGSELALWTNSNAYLEWTPAALQHVTIIVGEIEDLSQSPLKWHEIERVQIKPGKETITLILGKVDR